MRIKTVILMLFVLVILLIFTSCMPGDERYTDEKPAGFLWGVWHGWIAPISLIVGLFNKTTRIYESVNTGWWYDFGFYMAVISGFGGISLFRSKSN